jgi:pyruvate kinase
MTTSVSVARRLAAVWGVHAVTTEAMHSMTQAVEHALKLARLEGFASKGDEIVVVAGIPFGQAGTTNALRVVRL